MFISNITGQTHRSSCTVIFQSLDHTSVHYTYAQSLTLRLFIAPNIFLNEIWVTYGQVICHVVHKDLSLLNSISIKEKYRLVYKT